MYIHIILCVVYILKCEYFNYIGVIMSKRRQGPINKRLDFINNKLNKYSIRKFTVGTASILVGATLILVTLTMKQKQLKKIIWKILSK